METLLRWWSRMRTYARALFRRRRLEHELDDELRFHFEQQVAEHLEAGLDPAEARRRARLEFGALESVKDECRDQRRVGWLENWLLDLRFGARSLRSSPGLVVVSVLSLGLGTGLNFTLYTFTSAMFLQRPTMQQPQRVFGVEPGNGNQYSYLDYRDLREGQDSADLVGFRATARTVRDGDRTRRAALLVVTDNFFDVLGIEATLGRAFGSREAALEREPRLVVVTHGFWQSRLAADPDAVGSTLLIDGRPYVVTGVLPEGYRSVTGFAGPSLYVPLSRVLLPDLDERGTPLLTVLGRLRGERTAEQLRQAVTTLGGALEQAFPERSEGLGKPADVYPAAEVAIRGTPPGFRMFPRMGLFLFGLLLLLACGNVAGLLLARSVERRLELTIRVALGAGRSRVLQLLVAESFLLALLGSSTGLLVAFALARWSPPGEMAALQPLLTPDLSILFYAVGLIVLTTLVCGLGPALRAMRSDVLDRLKTDGGGSTGRQRARNVFVVAQVAGAVALLVLSALCLRSQIGLATVDLGFDVDHGVVARFDFEQSRIADREVLAFADEVTERLESIPGVRAVAISNVVPLGGASLVHAFHPAGRTDIPGTRPSVYSVGPGYFDTLSIDVLEGRELEERDDAGAEPVVVVSETFARTYFPGQPRLGRRVQTGDEVEAIVVGVVADVKIGTIGEAPKSVLYYPFEQRPRSLAVHVAAQGSPESLLRPVRDAIGELDPRISSDVETLRRATSLEMTMRRSATAVLATVGGVGLLLAMIGLYGVISNVVAARGSELGLRVALGATSGRLRVAVLARSVRLIATGIVLGWGLSLLLSPRLATFLVAVSPFDPWAFGGTAGILLVVGLAASYVPAQRASRVDPVVALRGD